jgi:hypothetical protein
MPASIEMGNQYAHTPYLRRVLGGRRSDVRGRLHGGISNAPAFQMWPSAVGPQPQDNVIYSHTYPWLGIRIGVIGDLAPGRP